MADVEEVGLDWRFGIPLAAVRIALRQLKRFYDEGEKQFASEIAKLEMRARAISPKDDELMDYLCDVRDERESLMDLRREFAIIGVFRTLERFLRTFLDPERHPAIAIPARTGPHFDQLKDQYKKIGVELTQPPFEWREIKKLQAIRNCIAHDEGWVDKKEAAKLRGYQLSVNENDWIKVPEDYFLEAYKLVDRTCRLVTEKCREVLKTRPTKTPPRPQASCGS